MKKYIVEIAKIAWLMWTSRHDGFTDERVKALRLKSRSLGDRLKLVRMWADVGKWAAKDVVMIGPCYPVDESKGPYLTSEFVDWAKVGEMHKSALYFMSKRTD
jgi:hypothetical protein